MSTDSKSFDVVIVGAGPAGSSLAIRLATAGFRVAIAEKKKFPRQKLCGEFVSPECFEHFDEIGVADQILASVAAELRETVFYSLSGRSVSIKSDLFGAQQAFALGLSRAAMDDFLLKRASEVGVTFFEETAAVGVVIEDGKLVGINFREKDGKRFDVLSSLAVDATGRGRVLVGKVNPQGKKNPNLTAFKTHLAGAGLEDGVCEIYSYPAGYGGLNAVGEVYNVCFVASADAVRKLGNDGDSLMRKLVMQNPRAAKTLANAKSVESWLAVAIDRFGTVDPAPVEGLIAIGDAASFIDPFTGSGMLMALESSRIATESIVMSFGKTDRLQKNYTEIYKAKFSQRLNYSRVLRFASTSTRLAEIAVATLKSSSYLRKYAASATRR